MVMFHGHFFSEPAAIYELGILKHKKSESFQTRFFIFERKTGLEPATLSLGS